MCAARAHGGSRSRARRSGRCRRYRAISQRIAVESWLAGVEVLGPVASVSVDAARRERHVLEHDVRHVRSKQELKARNTRRLPRHSGRHAGIVRVEAESAGVDVVQARLIERLIFRLERRLLLADWWCHSVADRRQAAQPLSTPVGIFEFVMRQRARHGAAHRQRQRRQRNRDNCISLNYARPPGK